MITFKAKRIDNGEWVEGWYYEYGNCTKAMMVIPGYEEHPEIEGCPIEDMTEILHVDPDTVTVLLDGKEVELQNLGDVMELLSMLERSLKVIQQAYDLKDAEFRGFDKRADRIEPQIRAYEDRVRELISIKSK